MRRAGLAAGATELLRTLSGGQYSLAVDGKGTFVVVDHRNADETRPARTLSGWRDVPGVAGAGAGAGRPHRRPWPPAARPGSTPSSSTRGSARSTPTPSTSSPPPSRSWARPGGWSGWSATSPSWRNGCRSASRSPDRAVLDDHEGRPVRRDDRAVRLAIDAWDPSYGSGTEGSTLVPSEVPVDIDAEVEVAEWAPSLPGTVGGGLDPACSSSTASAGSTPGPGSPTTGASPARGSAPATPPAPSGPTARPRFRSPRSAGACSAVPRAVDVVTDHGTSSSGRRRPTTPNAVAGPPAPDGRPRGRRRPGRQGRAGRPPSRSWSTARCASTACSRVPSATSSRCTVLRPADRAGGGRPPRHRAADAAVRGGRGLHPLVLVPAPARRADAPAGGHRALRGRRRSDRRPRRPPSPTAATVSAALRQPAPQGHPRRRTCTRSPGSSGSCAAASAMPRCSNGRSARPPPSPPRLTLRRTLLAGRPGGTPC